MGAVLRVAGVPVVDRAVRSLVSGGLTVRVATVPIDVPLWPPAVLARPLRTTGPIADVQPAGVAQAPCDCTTGRRGAPSRRGLHGLELGDWREYERWCLPGMSCEDVKRRPRAD
jgi:hypothetical protein